ARIPAWEPIFGETPTLTMDPLPVIGIGLPLLNTLVLIDSCVTMQIAVNAIKRGDRARLRNWLIPTIILGASFLVGQGCEYLHIGFQPRDGVFGAVFFTLTGFHGAHVTGGLVFNTIVFSRTLQGQFTARRHLPAAAASLYWPSRDVVWICLVIPIHVVH